MGDTWKRQDAKESEKPGHAVSSPIPWWLLEQQLLLLHGSCFSGRIHCDSSFLGGPCSRLWCPISLLCLSSTRRGGHTLKLLTSRSPHLSRLALSVPLTPLILGHLLFPRLLLQILSASLYVLPPLLSLLNQKDFANLVERKEKEETQIWYGYIPVLRKKIIKVKLTLNQHHAHAHTHAHTTLMEKKKIAT